MPSKIFEIEKTSYFRPWTPGCNEGELPSSTKTTEAANSTSPKPSVEEDRASIISSSSYHISRSTSSRSESSLDSDIGSGHSNEGRSASVDSTTEGQSLNMLSNFVFGTCTDRGETKLSKISTLHNCASDNIQPNDVLSVNYQCPFYPENYWHLKSRLLSHNTAVDDFTANYYLPPQMHYPSMEEAVHFLHQQDVAAKQLKKLRPKKFKCPECGVAFSNNGQLTGHIRIHTGERPFKCDFKDCDKSFTRNEELTRHKRIHTGAKPHKCVECGKKFGRKDHLKKHMRTHDHRRSYHLAAVSYGSFALNHAVPATHPISPYFYPV